jgi:hypothetical protein
MASWLMNCGSRVISSCKISTFIILMLQYVHVMKDQSHSDLSWNPTLSVCPWNPDVGWFLVCMFHKNHGRKNTTLTQTNYSPDFSLFCFLHREGQINGKMTSAMRLIGNTVKENWCSDNANNILSLHHKQTLLISSDYCVVFLCIIWSIQWWPQCDNVTMEENMAFRITFVWFIFASSASR